MVADQGVDAGHVAGVSRPAIPDDGPELVERGCAPVAATEVPVWVALAWAAGILVVSYTLALGMYRHRGPVLAAQ